MPRIVRAEFLKYYNPSRNSDKVFNIFLIEEDGGGRFKTVTEYGRRGNRLVRDTLCAGVSREAAESRLRQKLSVKRNHRETPYTDDFSGSSYSQIAEEFGFDWADGFENPSSERVTEIRQPAKVIQFPLGDEVAEKPEQKRVNPKQSGILNREQFDSLEI